MAISCTITSVLSFNYRPFADARGPQSETLRVSYNKPKTIYNISHIWLVERTRRRHMFRLLIVSIRQSKFSCAAPPTNLRATEAIKNFAWTVLPHPPNSPDIAPFNYQPFGPFRKKKGYARTPLRQWRCTELRAPVAAEMEEQLLLDGNTCSYLKVEEDRWQMWKLFWKITTPSAML